VAQSLKPIHLVASQKAQAAEVLARAFQSDPLMQYAFSEDARRPGAVLWLLGTVVRYCLSYGKVYTTPALNGVACWLSPGNTSLNIGRALRAGMFAAPFELGLEAVSRLSRNLIYAGRVQRRAVKEPHWYLWALGVDPPWQGRGIGGGLIQPVLARADADGVPCYLETHNERNVAFYERRGFELVSGGRVPETELWVGAMLRKPRE
jgi:ribosomal protein S18 acetylase RimI-like enzyme